MRNGNPIAELRRPSRPRGLSGAAFKALMERLPALDEDFAREVEEAREALGPPVEQVAIQLIDTSVLIDVERGALSLEPLATEGKAISVISVSELLHGVHRAERRPSPAQARGGGRADPWRGRAGSDRLGSRARPRQCLGRTRGLGDNHRRARSLDRSDGADAWAGACHHQRATFRASAGPIRARYLSRASRGLPRPSISSQPCGDVSFRVATPGGVGGHPVFGRSR